VILRRDLHLDVRIGSVVLDTPAHIFKPEGELGLRRDRPIDERVPREDADDSTPRSLSYQRSQTEELEGVTEDVAVRSGMLVGERNHRSHRRIHRIGLRLAIPSEVVPDPDTAQLLEQQLRHMSPPVVPHVDDQPLMVDLRAVVPVEFRVAARPHVRDVDVADPSIRLGVDPLSVGLDPVPVSQPELVLQRLDDHRVSLAAPAANRQRDGPARPIHQRGVRRRSSVNRRAFDGNQPITRFDVEAGSRQG